MSKLTSFTSASDALIQPSGATAGQTLTWNGTTGQFEPTTPVSGGTTLPNFTTNLGLRGDGTNIPVTDSRLNFATTDALDILSSGTNGLRVVTSVNKVSIVGIGVGTAAANNLEIRGNTPPVVTNANGGWLELNAGASRGTGFSSIRFSVPDGTGIPGQAPNAINLNWQMFATGNTNAVFEGIKDNNYVAAQLNKNIFVSSNGTGNASISADGTGVLNLGTGVGTGSINVGTTSTTRVTNLNGIVKRPNYVRFETTSNANQAIPANSNVALVFGGGNQITGSGIASVSTSAWSVARTGLYRIIVKLSVQSATANIRGMVSLTGSALYTTATATKAIRLGAANTPVEFETIFEVPVSTVGNIQLQINMTAASQINAQNVSSATATTTNLVIREVA